MHNNYINLYTYYITDAWNPIKLQNGVAKVMAILGTQFE